MDELLLKLKNEEIGIRSNLEKQRKLLKTRKEDLTESLLSLENLKDQIRVEKAKEIIDLELYAQLKSALEDTQFLHNEVQDAILQAEETVVRFQEMLEVNLAYAAEIDARVNSMGKVIPFDRKRSAQAH